MTLDLDAVRRRAEAAGVNLSWVLACALDDYAVTERESAEDKRSEVERRYLVAAADAAESLAGLALLDALETAEAEVERLRALLGHVVKAHGSVGTSELVVIRAALRTEGGAS